MSILSKYTMKLAAFAVLSIGCGNVSPLVAQETNGTVVRIAELEIDPAKMDAYLAAVKEEMDDAVRLEPGVIAIYAVAEKDHPNRLHFFEIYANEAAYLTHRETPHFKKYLAATQSMIVARRLIETVPVQLSAKPRN